MGLVSVCDASDMVFPYLRVHVHALMLPERLRESGYHRRHE